MRSGNSVLSVIDLINELTSQILEFKEILKSRHVFEQKRTDKQARNLLLYLFTSTRGGFTRLRIIMCLLERPYNTHQLAQELGLDYKAVQHHMKVLQKNNIVSKLGKKYGTLFHLSNFLEINIGTLYEAVDKLDKKMSYKKVYL